MHINDLLKIAVERKASDLHLKVGAFPSSASTATLTPAGRHATADAGRHDRDGLLDHVGPPEGEVQEQLRDRHRLLVPDLGRFRCNIFQQRGTVGLVLRVIPAKILSIHELLLPPVLEKICQERRGLVLCTGTTGSGKSTTLAAMIDHINSTRNEHIMTVEDPIEFLHRDKKSIVNQREVEVDTKCFSLALRSALRQDPDVILVGEMRDYETIETALTAAETGHLVFSTLHTLDATETINRIIAVFPPHQQKQIRLQLGAVLKAVISLRLMPRADGLGRVPAAEVLISTNYIRDCIENKEKTKFIKDAIQQGTSQYGMQTFDQSLYSLYKAGLITLDEALKRVDQPERVQAQDPGHPVHLRRRAGGDGRGPRGPVGLQSAPGGVALRLLEPAPSGTRLRDRRLGTRHGLPARGTAPRSRFRPGGAREGAAPPDDPGARPRGALAGADPARVHAGCGHGGRCRVSPTRASWTTSARRARSSAAGARDTARRASSVSSRPAASPATRSPRRSRRRRRARGKTRRFAARSTGSGRRGPHLAPPLRRRRVFDALTRRGFSPERISDIIKGRHAID